jgi:hypothetical protein
MSQNKKIEKFLKQGRSLTPMLALKLFNCWALSSRISELNKKGLNIKSEMIERDGKRFARYSIA